MRHRSLSALLLCLGVGIAATGVSCSSDSGTEPSNTLEATLESIQAKIFTPSCALSGCHVPGGSGPMPLRSAAESFASLVNKASVQKPTMMRVKAAHADSSYLIQKLEGANGISGSRMPLGRDQLSTEKISTIRAWIDAGAKFDGAGGNNNGY